MTRKFRKKPIEVEAIQWTGKNFEEIQSFVSWEPLEFNIHPKAVYGDERTNLIIPTLEGEMKAPRGWWIIKGIEGEFYPCKPDIFEKTYEPN